MRLSSSVTEETIYDSLAADALRSWGPERREVLEPQLRRFAHAIWLVVQEDLDPSDDGPDYLTTRHE